MLRYEQTIKKNKNLLDWKILEEILLMDNVKHRKIQLYNEGFSFFF